jgi:hypothetical protein
VNVCEDDFGDEIQIDWVPFHTCQVNLQNKMKKRDSKDIKKIKMKIRTRREVLVIEISLMFFFLIYFLVPMLSYS